MAERNDEYAEEYLPEDAEERHENRVERYLERIERWTGRSNPAQREMIAAEIASMPDTAELSLAYRRQQQQRLLALLRDNATRQQLTGYLASWWVDFSDRPDDLVRMTDELRRRGVALEVTEIGLGSVEHFFHFLWGYLLPALWLIEARGGAGPFWLRHCGPKMTPLIVAIIVGTYSSIYTASATALVLNVSPQDLIEPIKDPSLIDDLP
mgnify:CR=1 FL=1